MRLPWMLVFAPLLAASPAAAQELPPLPLPVPLPVPQPIVVPMPQPVIVPVPWPGAVPAPAPVMPVAPPPAPPPMVEPAWQYPQELPPPEPPPQKKVRGVLLAVDFGAAVPFGSSEAKTIGYGGDFRVGYRISAGPIWFAPEATAGIVDFPRFDGAIRFGAGGHIGVDAGLVEPSLYAFGGGFWNLWKQGPGVRAGASLDFRPGRYFAPGIHVDYNYAGWDTGNVRYVSPGVHMGFIIGR